MRKISVPPYILNIAKDFALESDVRRAKMSAVFILSRWRACSGAPNRVVFGWKKFTIHAEQNLIAKNRIIDFNRGRVLVYRYKKSINGPGTSKPCPVCWELMKTSGVKKVVFFDGKDWIEEKL